MVSIFLNSCVYLLFGFPFGIIKYPICFQYTILSNKCGAIQLWLVLFLLSSTGSCKALTVQERPEIIIKAKLHLNVCEETVRKSVIKLGYRVKKKSVHASEQEPSRCEGKMIPHLFFRRFNFFP